MLGALYMESMKNKPHMVIIDEDNEFQEQIKTFFSEKGYSVASYCNHEEVITKCITDGKFWDVLLMNLNLKKISSEIFIETVNKINPNLPIILMAPPEAEDDAIQIIKKGAFDFHIQPIHFPQLAIAVERAMKLKALKVDNSLLRERVKVTAYEFNGIVGKSPKFLASLEIAKRVAKSHANIFITGESGTGKEVFARYIHNESKITKGPFIAINCSAIPENLLESELFGHSKGAFTGAQDKKMGLFEAAENGTLFLDEIGDLSLNLQAKLLRVLQEKKIRRVGENQFRTINARIISATHKNLAEEIQNGQFREDLFYRLSVIPLIIPPLRSRPEDILPLAEYFLKKFVLENGANAKYFSKDAIKFMLSNNWRGNVRELENSIERAVVLTIGAEVKAEDFMISIIDSSDTDRALLQMENKKNKFTLSFEKELPSLEDAIQKYIEFAVGHNGGAKDRTAKEIGIDRKTLYKRLQIEK